VIELDGSQINLFGEQQENALKLLRRQGIKLEDPSAVNSFIFLNEGLFAPPGDQGPLKRLSSSVHTIFHEIGHSFSSLAGAKKEDYKLVNNLQKLTTQDPSLSYESITQKAIGSLQYHALEEARADSVGYALASRTSLKEYLSERLSLGGYAKLGGGFKSGYYNPRYKEKVSELENHYFANEIEPKVFTLKTMESSPNETKWKHWQKETEQAILKLQEDNRYLREEHKRISEENLLIFSKLNFLDKAITKKDGKV
jgi:hypothetical protein